MELSKDILRKEAVLRLELLKVSKEAIRIFESGKVPVTTFDAKLQDDSGIIHKKIVEMFMSTETEKLPIYMTESWHGADMISILYVDGDESLWASERERAKEGWHKVCIYIAENEQMECKEALFSIEHGNLWRVG